MPPAWEVDCLGAYGTIGPVKQYRIRLTDDELSLIVASLRARAAMTRGDRRHMVERLAERLAEVAPGNPMWRFSEETQIREEDWEGE